MKRLILLGLLAVFLPSVTSADTVIIDTVIDDVQTWGIAGSPYVLQNSSGGDVTVTQTGTLNIESGVLVKFPGGRKLDIFGTLNILGTSNNLVTFTNLSDSASGVSERWGGIIFNPGSSGEINFLDIRYTGFIHFPPPPPAGGGAVFNLGGNVRINNSQFSNNFQSIMVRGGGVTNVSAVIIQSDLGGIAVESGNLNLVDSKISGTNNNSLIITGASNFFSRNNSFENNIHNPVIDILSNFDIASTTFIGGDYNTWTIGGNVVGTKTLSPIDGKPIHTGGFIVESGNKLIVSKGTILKGGHSSYIIARGGEVEMLGTHEEPIIFTSIYDDSIGGDTNNDGFLTSPNHLNATQGIQAEAGGTLNLDHVEIRNTGASQFIAAQRFANAALLNNGGQVNANNLVIRDVFNDGIRNENGNMQVTNSRLEGNIDNTLEYTNGNFMVSSSSIDTVYRNSSLVNYDTLGVPDVRNNYWGTPEGPFHVTDNTTGTAPPIVGNALFKPFLTNSPFSTTTPARTPVIIIPGIMGSYLYLSNIFINNERWLNLPLMTLSPDDLYLNDLLLTSSGQSINNIESKNVISSIDAYDIFNGLEQHLSSRSLSVYAFPYDWRLDIDRSVQELRNKIEQTKLVTDSDKVDIVAHSMGGLLVKEYIRQYNGDSINKFIDAGTPHLGSLKTFKVLNYGDNFGFEKVGLDILNVDRTKIISQNMPSIYQLLPTVAYGTYLYDFDDIDGNGIAGGLSYAATKEFLKNTGRNSLLVDRADEFHQNLNNLNPVDYGVETYNFVGCGAPTLDKIFFYDRAKTGDKYSYGLSYTTGDGTVALKSANAITSTETYYLNNATHATMPSTYGVKEVIASILTGESIDITQYPNLSQSAPDCSPLTGTVISFHSPIELHIYDQQGNHVGPNANGDIENSIPGVSYDIIDHEKFAFLPEGESYEIKGVSTGEGTFTVRVEKIENEVVVETKQYSSIPLTATTKVEVLGDRVMIDSNGDGAADGLVVPDDTDVYELLDILREKIESLNIKVKVKNNLLKRVDNLEKRIEKRISKGKPLDVIKMRINNMIDRIMKKNARGKINDQDSQDLINILDQIESGL